MHKASYDNEGGIMIEEKPDDSEMQEVIKSWCEDVMKVFGDKYYDGLNKQTIEKNRKDCVNWIYAEVQAMYLKHPEIFANNLKDTMTTLYALDLRRIISNNNYWAYLVAECIFHSEPLGYFIQHYWDKDAALEEINFENDLMESGKDNH